MITHHVKNYKILPDLEANNSNNNFGLKVDKGTASVVTNDPPWKDSNARLENVEDIIRRFSD